MIHDLDGADIAAHRTAVLLLGTAAFPVCLGLDRVDADIEHGLPIEVLPCDGHLGIGGMPFAAHHIAYVSRDLRCYEAFLDIINVREREVFCRCEVAKEIRTCLRSDRTSYGAYDVIVTWSYVRDERAQDVERGVVSELFLKHHVAFDLIQRHVSGTFHHRLYARFAGSLDEMA